MRLSISNIAWDPAEDTEIAKLLKNYHINAIDIAPSKYFSNFFTTGKSEIVAIKNYWLDHGIELVGMQSLLFGTQGLNIFGSPSVQAALLKHLAAVCRISAILGISRLVFGSPKNRDRTGLGDEEALTQAIDFFRRLGNIALHEGVVFCLEPNPICYGSNFMTSSCETAQVVMHVNHPAIRMQLDTGALLINDESIDSLLNKHAHLIAHIHVSEPGLVPLGDLTTNHSVLFHALKKHLPNHIASIEMLATKNEPHTVSIERALIHAITHYRPEESFFI